MLYATNLYAKLAFCGDRASFVALSVPNGLELYWNGDGQVRSTLHVPTSCKNLDFRTHVKKLAYLANYLRTYLTNLNQIFTIGRNKCVDD